MDADFFSGVRSLRITDASLRSDDDFADRLNYHYTTVLIIIFAVLISAKQYVGKPIQCWVYAEFTEQWENYAENYCWIKNTYFIPRNTSEIPQHPDERKRREITYYQYVPFILALMALAFYLPKMVWKILNHRTGVNIAALVQEASSIIRSKPTERQANIQKLAKDFKERVTYQADDKDRKAYLTGLKTFMSCFTCGSINSFGSFLTLSYLFTKLLFVINSIGLLIAVVFMLHSTYRPFDLQVFWDLTNSKSWKTTGIFPRVTFCDMEIRRSLSRYWYTVQCVLMINLFNEKIFTFLWFWFALMFFVNLGSLLYWILYAIPIKQRSFVQEYLRTLVNDNPNEGPIVSQDQIDESINDFVNVRLHNDGIFILRLIASNSGHLVTTELVQEIWKSFYLQPVEVEPNDNEKSVAV